MLDRSINLKFSTAENLNNHSLNSSTISYIEFQTRLIKIFEQIGSEKLSTRLRFKKIIESGILFQDSDKISVHWPLKTGDILLFISSTNHDNPCLDLSLSEKKSLVNLSIKKSDELCVEYKNKLNEDFSLQDIAAIALDFNQVIGARTILYVNQTESIQTCRPKKKLHCDFNKNTFNKFIQQYSLDHITYKINNVILNHSLRSHNNFTFYLKWPVQNKVSHLKACFSRSDKFYLPANDEAGYSWFITEKTLLNQFPEYRPYNIPLGQYYYSLKIFETDSKHKKKNDEEVEILSLWLTADALFGELHGVHKGNEISGNEVLEIYKFFDNLFRVRKTFICDASKISVEETDIPLRVILALATGKTWYQTKLANVKLFDCKNLMTAHDGKITQSSLKRDMALNELQKLTLDKWHDMLSAKDQQKLLNLINTYFSDNTFFSRFLRSYDISNISQFNLQELTSAIYKKSKDANSKSSDLVTLTRLLCDGLGVCDDTPAQDIEKAQLDYWIKSRMNTLVWGSFFWVKESNTEEPVSTLRI